MVTRRTQGPCNPGPILDRAMHSHSETRPLGNSGKLPLSLTGCGSTERSETGRCKRTGYRRSVKYRREENEVHESPESLEVLKLRRRPKFWGVERQSGAGCALMKIGKGSSTAVVVKRAWTNLHGVRMFLHERSVNEIRGVDKSHILFARG